MSDRRLLIIDDDPAIAEIVRAVAEGLEYEVRFTERADEFADLYETFRPTIQRSILRREPRPRFASTFCSFWPLSSKIDSGESVLAAVLLSIVCVFNCRLIVIRRFSVFRFRPGLGGFAFPVRCSISVGGLLGDFEGQFPGQIIEFLDLCERRQLVQ